MIQPQRIVMVLLFAFLTSVLNVQAGISPENVVVVVNADSTVSRTIANHYIHARDIPTGNVVLLKGVPTDLQISLADFKSKILSPTLDTLNARGIAAQTRVIAYSADFPTAVNVASHRAKVTDPNIKKLQAGVASINGATFFYQFILADQPGYLNWGSNMYARGKFDRHFANPFGDENKAAFDTAAKDFSDGRWEAAAKTFAELFKKYPSMSPLAIRAAEAYAAAGDKPKATEWLVSAVRAGWWSAEYLKTNEHLAGLLDDPVLAPAMKVLRTAPIAVQGPIGFANHRAYTPSGHAVAINQGGVPYLLSCSLAVVHERGSTVEQAINVLQRAAKADRTFPKGDFRFAANEDVRAKTRFPNIADALVYLQDAGYKTEVFRSILPTNPGDVCGLMVGRATVDLASRKWSLVPGAIAENLTSYGGAYNIKGHTKITEFLHAGAAMSSGTVAEPYALQFKFPLPMMYGYYADGVSAIEAFYLSVSSPYQLLIVGDPICQPFAKAPGAWVDISESTDKKNRIMISMQPVDLKQPKTQTREIELYVGGRLMKQAPPATKINFDLPETASGVIDLRVALIGFDPTEPKISFTAELDLSGPFATPVATTTQHRTAESTEMKFSLKCKNAESIELMHLNQVVGTVKGAAGDVTVDTKPMGNGPLRFRARAHFGKSVIWGLPIVDEQ